ncbi:MAG: fumarylacetoacetate hydrolase family protein [Acidobacteriota bacterium]|nr:fumarylacetoacetate hydrolase family protein [Acidobacteriota bacterium]
MKLTPTLIATAAGLSIAVSAVAESRSYVRFEKDGRIAYGRVMGDSIVELEDNFLVSTRESDMLHPLSGVKLLAPVVPSKVIAVGLNYRSHLGNAEPAKEPGLFFKSPTSIVGPDADIVLPPGATNTHYESEMVLVIGKRAKSVSVEEAPSHIFGVTAGNDVSERAWQRSDLQWFRAKGSDTFGPIGPVVATGLDPDDLMMVGKLNGEVMQKQSTSDLLFGSAKIVSYLSSFLTLEVGDVIFTGTPGSTKAMKPGDVFEIELEGVGTLRNPIASR